MQKRNTGVLRYAQNDKQEQLQLLALGVEGGGFGFEDGGGLLERG